MVTLNLGLLWYVAFLFSTTVHEAAHAWVAFRLGDPTAYHGGQVTLNPIPHIRREPFGTVFFPIFTFLLSGWMIGWASAPFNPAWAERYPRRAAWMALAGPISNLLIAIAAGLAIRIGVWLNIFFIPDKVNITTITLATSIGWPEGAAVLLSIVFTLNIILFSFNLIPLRPLDGSLAIILFMKDQTARRYWEIMLNPTFSTLGLLLAWYIYKPIFRIVFHVALAILYPGEY